jgi:hypothetical protein
MESMTQFIFLGALQNIRQTLQQLSWHRDWIRLIY